MSQHRMRKYVQKLRDLAVAQARKQLILAPRENYSREFIEEHQKHRLQKILRHALKKSPYYREKLKGFDLINPRLEDLPVLSKKDMLSHYDELVIDSRLQLSALNTYLDGLQYDEYHPHGYKVFRSGGSTGKPAVMAYSASEFSWVQAQILRSSAGLVKLPYNRRLRAANVYARTPTHDSVRISQSFQVGFHKVRDFAVDTPLDILIDELNRFNPDILNGYPSVIAELAHARAEKRLKINPQTIFLGSEPLTPDMRQNISRGFGIEPFDHYGTTEAIVMASECRDHRGLHLEEDMHIIEIVDRNGKPARPGETGHKVFVTNLHAFTQPIIRYEVSDMMMLDDANPGPCSCGSQMRLIKRVLGRNEDLFEFQNVHGETAVITPEDIRLALAKCQNVRQYQVIRSGDSVRIKAILYNDSVENHSRDQIIKNLSALFQKSDIKIGRIAVDFVKGVERNPMACQKFRQVSNG